MAEVKKLNISDLKVSKSPENKSKKQTPNKDGGEEKKDKIWMVPLVSAIIAVLVVTLILSWGKIASLFGGGGSKYDKPFTSISTTEVVTKMENKDEFLILMYTEDCVHCRAFIFGSEDGKTGDGTIRKYSRETNIHFRATWANAGENFNTILGNWMTDLDDKLRAKGMDGDFDWRSKIFDESTNSFKPAANYSSKDRPSVPALMYFKGGALKAILEGNQPKSQIISFINKF